MSQFISFLGGFLFSICLKTMNQAKNLYGEYTENERRDKQNERRETMSKWMSEIRKKEGKYERERDLRVI